MTRADDDMAGACCLLNERRAEILVDAADLPALGTHRWRAQVFARTKSKVYEYVTSSVGGGALLLHRAISGCPKGMVVDHINGNGLDNRRRNLRVCTHRDNMRNSARRYTNQLGLKGVVKQKNRYTAAIRAGGKVKALGHFATAEEAHAAYCKAAAELHGEFARFA